LSTNTFENVKYHWFFGETWQFLRFEISRTGVSPILKCLKNRAVVFIKESQVCPNTEIDLRLTRLGAMSGSWASHVCTTEMICGCVEKAALVGTARKSLRWELIATQSIAGVLQIEDLLSQ
jgi:hypothetical protein